MRFRNVSPNACRVYLAGADGGREVLVVDPVLDRVEEYLALLDREKLRLTHVLDTHTHADHLSAGAALRDATGCEYLMHGRAAAPCVTGRIEEGMDLEIAGVRFRVMHTPGHTRDSVSLIFPDRILTGDVLFLDEGGAGRDDLPGGDPGEHWDSLQRILTLPGHLLVFPAHEYRDRPESSLRRQRDTNPHLRPPTRDAYIRFVQDLKLGPAEWMKAVLKANNACTRDPKAVEIPCGVPACEVQGSLGAEVRDLPVEQVTPARLREMLGSGAVPLLLDVREEEELTGEYGSLPGILHIPIGDLEARCPEIDADRNRPIVTICRSGRRARTAAQFLLSRGFSEVRILAGGMKAWREGGFTAPAALSRAGRGD